MLTYQDKYQIVSASDIYSKKSQFVVNCTTRPDDGYAQDNGYFYQSAKTLKDVLWLVDCFFSELDDFTAEQQDELSASDYPSQESRYLQKLGRRIDGSLSEHWITLEIIANQDNLISYKLVGSSNEIPITEPLKDLLDREYVFVLPGNIPEQLKSELYTDPFDTWIINNYTPAGKDASTGEKWFLSMKPTEYLPIALSKLREQYHTLSKAD